MAENYLQKATQIYNGFDAESSREWLRKNGMKELAKMLLDDMADARSEEDFKTAEYQFKNRIVVPFFKDHVYPRGEKAVKAFVAENPIINVAPPKSVGSYDDLKKNQAFADSRYAQAYTDEKGNRVVNVPLLQIANDPEELSLAALRLGITPEDLHDHIVNEWRRKKEKEWPELEAAMKKEMLANRGKVVKEYNKSPWSSILRTVAPELYAGMRRDIAEGKGNAGSISGWLGEHKKDAAIDAARNTALAMTGYATSPLSVAGLVGATELSSLAASDHYDMNARNVGAALTGATFAGTVPSLVTRYAAPLLKSGNKTIRNAARDILRRIRNGEGTAAEVEQAALKESVDEAAKIVRSRVAGNETLTSEDVRNAVNAVYQKVISSPRIAFADGTRITQSDIERALLTEDGVNRIKGFLSAPSKKTWVEWNKMSKYPEYGYEQRVVLQDAMKRAEEMFPEAVKEIKYISGNGKTLNSVIATGANVFNTVGSKAEPMAARNVYAEGLSSYEADHPEQLEAWKRYGIPSWEPLAEEFNEKYGEGK